MPLQKRKSHSTASSTAVFLSALKKYALFAGRRWWALLILTAIGCGIAYWKSSKQAPVYISHARMMVAGKIDLPEGAVYSEELGNFYGTQIELMQSSEIQRRAATRVDSAHPELRAQPVSISSAQQRGTSFFVMTAACAEPQYCQAFLDAVMVEYVEFKREMRSESADTAVTSVTDQLLRLEKELDSNDDQIAAFKKKDGSWFLEDEGNSPGKYIIALKGRRYAAKTKLNELQGLDGEKNIERQVAEKKSNNNADGDNSVVDKLTAAATNYLAAKQQIQVIQADVDRLGRYLRAEHPKMKALTDKIAEQQRLITLYKDQSAADLDSQRAALSSEIDTLDAEIKELEPKAGAQTEKIAEFERLKSKRERNKTLIDRLLATVQNVDVNKSLGQDVVRVMEHASVPVASNPGLVKDVTSGGAIGFACGLSILILFALLDDRVSSIVEVQSGFDEEILAQVPREPWNGPLDLMHLESKHPMLAEAARNLRSSLLFMSFEGERPKTILVTSSIPDEGKSTISSNLAIALAATGAKTLLVDGDLRKGALHELFNSKQTPGLAEVLRREVSSHEAVRTTAWDNLFFLPRGRSASDAAELYLRDSTDDFLRQIYQEYEYIVFDSAPVLAKEDTASFAPKIDATLFVVRAGVASLRRSKSAVDILTQRNVNILGLVYNSASKSSPGYYYYQSYGPASGPAGPTAPADTTTTK